MPRVFLYILLCTKGLDKNEKLPVGQAGVLSRPLSSFFSPFILTMNCYMTRKAIPHWECFPTSRTTMSDWPTGGCALLHFLWVPFPWILLIAIEMRPLEMMPCYHQLQHYCQWMFWFGCTSASHSLVPHPHLSSLFAAWVVSWNTLIPQILGYGDWPPSTIHLPLLPSCLAYFDSSFP